MSRPVEPDELYTLLATPTLIEPVLVVHLAGWIDAGQSAEAAMRHLDGELDTRPLVSFDTEWLIDHRARRPTMQIVDGVNTGLEWPSIEMRHGTDSADRDVIVLTGAEPDHNWRAFVDAVTSLCSRYGVTKMIGLGSYPAAVPHTRVTHLSVTAATPDLAAGPYANATLDVPAGVEAAIELALHAAEVPALGLWAQVPHYVSGTPYPAAVLALVEGLRDHGITVDATGLAEQAMANRRRLDTLVAGEESHQEMIAELERRFDETETPDPPVPTSDEIAEQVEEFLRSQKSNPEEEDPS